MIFYGRYKGLHNIVFICFHTEFEEYPLTPGFLNVLNIKNRLPKTVIYSLSPGDNELIDTALGCFQ